jgi:hypothetical protein
MDSVRLVREAHIDRHPQLGKFTSAHQQCNGNSGSSHFCSSGGGLHPWLEANDKHSSSAAVHAEQYKDRCDWNGSFYTIRATKHKNCTDIMSPPSISRVITQKLDLGSNRIFHLSSYCPKTGFWLQPSLSPVILLSRNWILAPSESKPVLGR